MATFKVLFAGAAMGVCSAFFVACEQLNSKTNDTGTLSLNSESINYFQVRFSTTTGVPQPAIGTSTMALFTWGTSWMGARQTELIPYYVYDDTQTIHGHFPTVTTPGQWNSYDKLVVALSNSAALSLFQGQTNISQDILTIRDILEFYRVYYPRLVPNIGLQLNSNGAIYVDATGNVLPTGSERDNQDGLTILTPALYNVMYPTRTHFNYRNPVMCHYLAERAAKYALSFGTKNIALDNVNAHGSQFPYLLGQTPIAKAENYAHDTNCILKRLTDKGFRIMANALRDRYDYDSAFQNIIINGLNYEGLMIEESFTCPTMSGSTCALQSLQKPTANYLQWAKFFHDHSKKLLFATGNFGARFNPDQVNPERTWLWINLIGNSSSYLSMSPDFVRPSPWYDFYGRNIGTPLTLGPEQIGRIWVREFTHGRIEFVEPSASDPLGTIRWIQR